MARWVAGWFEVADSPMIENKSTANEFTVTINVQHCPNDGGGYCGWGLLNAGKNANLM